MGPTGYDEAGSNWIVIEVQMSRKFSVLIWYFGVHNEPLEHAGSGQLTYLFRSSTAKLYGGHHVA